ncbi:hypothetical protein B0T16DRAFT_402450 [Cercophora newfieldiana]|uniref:Uncharacterized protein n=1 Tax=Cercophora newfieldiana TaxID=92897 RepID=A0AA39YUI6_9PEZI|nr:hypothetical protein B0T16DRAFT_402450 [Cercophora newfieldiana]
MSAWIPWDKSPNNVPARLRMKRGILKPVHRDAPQLQDSNTNTDTNANQKQNKRNGQETNKDKHHTMGVGRNTHEKREICPTSRKRTKDHRITTQKQQIVAPARNHQSSQRAQPSMRRWRPKRE